MKQDQQNLLEKLTHEVRTFLSVILGHSTILENEISIEKCLSFNNMIQNRGQDLKKMLNDVSDYQRLSSQSCEIDDAWFSFPLFLEKTLSIIRKNSETHSLNYNCQIAEPIPLWVNSDQKLLGQLFLSTSLYLMNITPQKSIDIEITSKKTKNCKSENDKSNIQFIITFDGALKDNLKEEIFVPFALNSIFKDFEGSGLELCLAQKIASQMDGSITIMNHLPTKNYSIKIDLTLEAI